MELEDNYHHACKRPCVGNGHPATKIGHEELQHQDEDEEDGEKKKKGGRRGWAGISSGTNCLMPWQNHPSSRIYRVSRASGGKDRHSKVYTAKGLRDRRVRLSVSTAIQFYDLQDRLGFDQPSKAIEWLIKAATAAIDELPLLDNFLSLPSQHPTDQDMPVEVNPEGDPSYNGQRQQHLTTKSGCSSNSETSKGSMLSLSQSENQVKKREQARERTVKDRDEDRGPAETLRHQKNLSSNLNTNSPFTELLTAGGSGSNGATAFSAVAATGVGSNPSSIPKQVTADYFSQAGLFIQSQKNPQLSSSFSSSSNFGHSPALGVMPFNFAASAVVSPGEQPEMHQFSFLQDHLTPVSAAAETGDYNLNFSMSSSFAGFNRGTLQSNSSSQFSHHNHQHHLSNHNHLHQRFSTPVDGSNLPLLFGSAGAVANITENQFPPGFDGRLQLYYGEGFRHSDLKGKRKS